MTKEEAKNEFWRQNGVFERGLSNSYKKVIMSYFIGSEFDLFIDKIYDENKKAKSCDGCINSPENNGGNYRLECGECRRFYADRFEEKK